MSRGDELRASLNKKPWWKIGKLSYLWILVPVIGIFFIFGLMISHFTSKISEMNTRYAVLFEDYEHRTQPSADGIRMAGGSLNFDAIKSHLVAEVRAELAGQPPPKSVPVRTEAELFAREVAQVVPTEFVRDDSVPLVDQINNPGGLVMGGRAIEYGATGEHLGHAIFPDRVMGVAALIDLLIAHEGVTVRSYLVGDEDTPKHLSYTGGNKKAAETYLAVFRDRYINLNGKMTSSRDLLKILVSAHSHTEGSVVGVSDEEFNEAICLVSQC